jgi:hypothetical protein
MIQSCGTGGKYVVTDQRMIFEDLLKHSNSKKTV